MFEKRLAAVSPQLLLADGGVSGLITITDTSLFKVKQEVILTANTLSNLDTIEVKKVISATQMVVGPRGGNINATIDISSYTTALVAKIMANEQKRPTVPLEEHDRAIYEEEPVVADRVILVDKLGNKIDQSNPLPTTASISVGDLKIDIANPSVFSVLNIPIASANTEYTINIPIKTQRFTMKIRDSKSQYKIKATSGGPYVSYSLGQICESGNVDTPAINTIYIETYKANCVLEVLLWMLP